MNVARAAGAVYASRDGHTWLFVISFCGGARPAAGFESGRLPVRLASTLVVCGAERPRDVAVC